MTFDFISNLQGMQGHTPGSGTAGGFVIAAWCDANLKERYECGEVQKGLTTTCASDIDNRAILCDVRVSTGCRVK